MTIDTDAFTLSLFDNAAAPDWNHHTSPTSSDVHDADDGDEADDDTEESGDVSALAVTPVARGSNFHLEGERDLARGWAARARDNIAAIRLSKALEQSGNTPTKDEQAQLLRFIGFGATELAQNCFRRPGETIQGTTDGFGFGLQ